MSDPVEAISWLILGVSKARMQTVLAASGYWSDAGLRVDDERPSNDDDLVYPRIAVGIETMTPVSSNPDAIIRDMVILAEGYVQIDGDNAERDAARMQADLVRAWMRTRPNDFESIATASGRVVTFEVKGEQATLRSPDLGFIVVQVRATVRFTEYIPPVTG